MVRDSADEEAVSYLPFHSRMVASTFLHFLSMLDSSDRVLSSSTAASSSSCMSLDLTLSRLLHLKGRGVGKRKKKGVVISS